MSVSRLAGLAPLERVVVGHAVRVAGRAGCPGEVAGARWRARFAGVSRGGSSGFEWAEGPGQPGGAGRAARRSNALVGSVAQGQLACSLSVAVRAWKARRPAM